MSAEKTPGRKAIDNAKRTRKSLKQIRRVARAVKRAIKTVIRAVRAIIRSVRRVIYIVSVIGAPAILAVLAFVLIMAIFITIINIGPKIVGFGGSDPEEVQKIIALGDVDQLKEKIDQEVGDSIAIALDCSTKPPSERKPNVNCIEGLLDALESGGASSPVPERANYMVPVWQAAGRKYQVPWMLLAAIEGARTNFGLRNCEDTEEGSGVYRILDSNWERYASNGGSVSLEPSAGSCFDVITPDEAVEAAGSSKEEIAEAKDKYKLVLGKYKPISSLKADLSGREPDSLLGESEFDSGRSSVGNIFDPVDAAFTQARILAHSGAFKSSKWEYTGSGPGQCSTDQKQDGQVWYYTPGSEATGPGGGRYGYNSKLKIPPQATRLAAKYVSPRGKWRPQESLDVARMPKKDIVYLLRTAWQAFGVRGAELNNNVTLNYAQVSLESGGAPQRIQLCDGTYEDVNCDNNNPARGLLQFIPGTFAAWKVDGFDDIYNPLDSILAAVNAQVNTEMSILDGGSGWGPGSGSNPYTTGGKARNVAPKTDGKPVAATPYRGKEQSDRVSKAVAYRVPGAEHSACYTAVVNQWYEAIKKNPPNSSMSLSGPAGQRIVKIAEAELKKGIVEQGGNNPYYKNGKIAPYNIGSAPWCQAFAAWVWYQAGVKQIAKITGMRTASGLDLPAYTGAVTAAAQLKQHGLIFKTKNPQPGDMAMYSDTHVELVTKVANGRVIETIGGNTSDTVFKRTGPTGITHFIGVPGNVGRSSYQTASPRNVDLDRKFAGLTKRLGVEAGVAVSRGGKTSLLGDLQLTHAWSTIKVPIVVALVKERGGYQRLSSEERGLVRQALTSSQNAAAEVLFSRIADNPKVARARIDALFAAVGDNTEVNGANSAPPYSTYGQTNWTLRAANRFFLGLAQGRLLNRASSQAILDQLERVIPEQQWGLGAAGFNVPRFKGGWGPDNKFENRYLLRQTGLQGNTAISLVLAPTSSQSFAEMTAIASKIGAWLKKNIGKMPAGSPDPKLTTAAQPRSSSAAAGWIKVGATWYDETTSYNKPEYKGLTYAELLVAGANAGYKDKALSSILDIQSPNWVGMPMGTPLLIKMPGSRKVIKIYKIDNGSGQGGETEFKIDLNSGTVRALGFKPENWGRRTVWISKVGR